MIQTTKVRAQESIETKMFSVLKEIGVELSSYHGGSLNGKDIRKVMTNASYIFDSFAIIFKAGKRPNCALSDANIDALCLQFREVFVLWDGAFSLARTINPTEMDITTYRMFVDAAAKGSKDLRCTVTPKVHIMLEHVEWQMRNIWGGVRRQNGRLGRAITSRWEARSTAISYGTKSPHSLNRARESTLSRDASGCNCKDNEDK